MIHVVVQTPAQLRESWERCSNSIEHSDVGQSYEVAPNDGTSEFSASSHLIRVLRRHVSSDLLRFEDDVLVNRYILHNCYSALRRKRCVWWLFSRRKHAKVPKYLSGSQAVLFPSEFVGPIAEACSPVLPQDKMILRACVQLGIEVSIHEPPLVEHLLYESAMRHNGTVHHTDGRFDPYWKAV